MFQTSFTHDGSARPASQCNQRATVRYRCALAAMGKVVSLDDHEMQRAWILDLSTRGVGIQLARRLEPGLIIILSLTSNDDSRVFEIPAKVMHCTEALHGEWQAGCEFDRALTRDELDALL